MPVVHGLRRPELKRHPEREGAGLLPNTEVDFVIDEGTVSIVKLKGAKRPTRGGRAVQQLRRQGLRVSMTTDETMALTRGEG
jgi:hypothetical protein